MNGNHIVIVGGGISGLSAAYRLSELSRTCETPLRMTLVEADHRLGGVIGSEKRDGFLLESGPDSFISEKPAAMRLCGRLGIESEIIPTQEQYRRSFIVRRWRLVSVPEGFYLIAPGNLRAFLGSELLSWPGKIRMASEIFVPPREVGGDESVGSFVRRRFGREALERIGQPMIGGIYTADPERLSLQATFPQFQDMEREHGSVIKALYARKKRKEATETTRARGPRYSLFLSFRSGIGTLVDALVKHVTDVSLRCGVSVTRIESGERWKVYLGNGEVLEADAVCLAVRAHQASDLLRPFADEISMLLDEIPYESVATVNVAYRAEDVPTQLNGFGFVAPKVEHHGIVGCTFSSVKFAGRARSGFVLLRAFVGGALDPNMFALSDGEMQQMVMNELRKLLGICREPHLISIRRHPLSMPQYHVGHLGRIASIHERLKRHRGLYLTGNAYRGIGLGDCVDQAEKAADGIVSYLRSRQEATI